MHITVQASKRVLLAYAVLAFIPIILGSSLYAVSSTRLQTEALRRQKDTAEWAAETLGSRIRNLSDRLHVLTFTMQQGNIPLQNQIGLFSMLIASQSGVFDIVILSRSGKPVMPVVHEPILKKEIAELDPEGRKQYLVNERQTLWISTQSGRSPRLDIYSRFSPVADLRISVDLETFVEKSFEDIIPASSIILLDNKGRQILFPDDITPEELARYYELPMVQDALKRVSVGASDLMHINGMEMLVGFARVPDIPVVMLIRSPSAGAYSSRVQMKHIATSIIVILTLISWVALASIVRTPGRSRHG